MDVEQAKPTGTQPMGIPLDYDLASHVALPAQSLMKSTNRQHWHLGCLIVFLTVS